MFTTYNKPAANRFSLRSSEGRLKSFGKSYKCNQYEILFCRSFRDFEFTFNLLLVCQFWKFKILWAEELYDLRLNLSARSVCSMCRAQVIVMSEMVCAVYFKNCTLIYWITKSSFSVGLIFLWLWLVRCHSMKTSHFAFERKCHQNRPLQWVCILLTQHRKS